MEPLNLSVTYSSERSDCQHWDNIRRSRCSRVEQSCQFTDSENLWRIVRQFRARSVQDRIVVDHPAPLCIAEKHANVCPVVCAAFRGTRKRAEPIIQFFHSDSGNLAIAKVSAETRETFFQVVDVCRTHSILALCVQYLSRQLRHGHVAPTDSFQVIQVKGGRVADGLAVFGKFLAGLDDRGEFTRRQTYGLAPVALQGWDRSGPFRVGFGFGLEKLPASIKRTEIEIPGMRFAVAIFEDSKGWAFHGPKICAERLGVYTYRRQLFL